MKCFRPQKLFRFSIFGMSLYTGLVVINGGPLGVCVVELDGGHPDGGGLVLGHPVLELVILQIFEPEAAQLVFLQITLGKVAK